MMAREIEEKFVGLQCQIGGMQKFLNEAQTLLGTTMTSFKAVAQKDTADANGPKKIAALQNQVRELNQQCKDLEKQLSKVNEEADYYQDKSKHLQSELDTANDRIKVLQCDLEASDRTFSRLSIQPIATIMKRDHSQEPEEDRKRSRSSYEYDARNDARDGYAYKPNECGQDRRRRRREGEPRDEIHNKIQPQTATLVLDERGRPHDRVHGRRRARELQHSKHSRLLVCNACYAVKARCDNAVTCAECISKNIECVRTICPVFQEHGDCQRYNGGCFWVHDEEGYNTSDFKPAVSYGANGKMGGQGEKKD